MRLLPQITSGDLDIAADWPLFLEPEQKWYRTGEVETGVHQFLVQDPDGYLVRFSTHIGERPASGAQP